jgi:hypothetical protein
VAAGRARLKQAHHQIIEGLADALERPHLFARRDEILIWRSGDRVEYAHAAPYYSPCDADPARPAVLRVYINKFASSHIETEVRRAGWEAKPKLRVLNAPEPPQRDWSFELSILPKEAESFVPFLVGLILAHEHQDPSLMRGAPSELRFFTEEQPLKRWHAWSAAAWAAADAYDTVSPPRQRARLLAACGGRL